MEGADRGAGYYPFRTTEKIHAGEATAVKYYVEKGSYNPYDVTVTAAKPRKEVSRTVISATEIEKIPGTVGDPLVGHPGLRRRGAGAAAERADHRARLGAARTRASSSTARRFRSSITSAACAA